MVRRNNGNPTFSFGPVQDVNRDISSSLLPNFDHYQVLESKMTALLLKAKNMPLSNSGVCLGSENRIPSSGTSHSGPGGGPKLFTGSATYSTKYSTSYFIVSFHSGYSRVLPRHFRTYLVRASNIFNYTRVKTALRGGIGPVTFYSCLKPVFTRNLLFFWKPVRQSSEMKEWKIRNQVANLRSSF
jgi:hypothetical protein